MICSAAFRHALTLLLLSLLALWALAASARDAPETFEVGSLNDGLPPAADWIDRSTPQGLMESLVFATETGRWEEAAQLFDLSDIPQGDQQAAGSGIARDLAQIIERKIVIDWFDLPDRPDGAVEPGEGQDAIALQPRRSLPLWTLDLPDRPVELRMNRLQVGEEDPVWVISRQSVANIPALALLYRPSALETAIPDALREDGIWGLQAWELIALPLVLLLTGLAGFVFYKALGALARGRLAGRGGRLLLAAQGPLTLAVVTLVLSTLARSVLIFSGQIDTILTPLTASAYVIAAFWMVISFGDAVIDRLIDLDGGNYKEIGEGHEDRRRIATRVVALRRALLVVVVLAAFGILLNEVAVFRSLGISLLASAGGLALLLGFAARNVLSNIMASLQIALNGSAKIGDKIVWDDRICVVERINFTYVQLQVWSGERIVVPVVEFVDTPFENWTMKDPSIIRKVTLKLAHGFDAQTLRDDFDRILDEIGEGIGADEDRGVAVTGHDVFGQDVLFKVPCTDPNTAWTIECEVREKLLRIASERAALDGRIFPEAAAAEGGA
ncbi:mechanosensitive ion channel family protein [Wenxinia saemankumensis]|uniref:Small-conductance mechanosensitive channel n=1 Tax=Wenxinia saemankumensis TaxID=1447782 RepID=A0A1M6D4L1_9RHOB|nr:mechanosensitive ion channel domain-containing protein [Wenxinia saemankumensis]SHI68187.1 Small-conductance mechanosensitive channel [Wenxinia saemankumensis]